ncbi:LysR substrate-binding domain-containing protein [Pokkaliibacter sp. CJK22405]|uniref:LysR family transcriptional regulator n=1 Tax=Pokkaliibacter sp. CJK22405 TaxID=3384615 RepID=UPI0039849BB1
MDKLQALRALVMVAEQGGFSRAAKQLGVATSSVTRLIDSLESSLEAALLTRTTRKVSLTEAGLEYVERIKPLLDELDDADSTISDVEGPLTGSLRVSLPSSLSRKWLNHALLAFMREHPDVVLDVSISDQYQDLALERLDLAIRIGVPSNYDNLVIRRISAMPRYVVASPEYLDRKGTPEHPNDLQYHDYLRFAWNYGSLRLYFSRGYERGEVMLHGPLITNSPDLLLEAALDGRGMCLLPVWLVLDHLRAGRLVRLFADWDVRKQPHQAELFAAYLPNRRNSRKLQMLVRHLERWLKERVPEELLNSDSFVPEKKMKVVK